MTADWKSMDWGELLASLRRDLQLDPATDLNGGVLRALTAGGARVAYGTATITWDGINKFSTGTTVVHGLGSTPSVLLGSGIWGTRDFGVGFSGVNLASFDVYGDVLGAALPPASTDTVYWQAIA